MLGSTAPALLMFQENACIFSWSYTSVITFYTTICQVHSSTFSCKPNDIGHTDVAGSSAKINSVLVQPPSPQQIQREMFTQFPMETRMDSYAQTDDEEEDDDDPDAKAQIQHYFPDVALMNHSFGSSSLDMGVQTDEDSTQSEDNTEKVLIPSGNDDLQLRERSLPLFDLASVEVKETEKVKDKGKGKKSMTSGSSKTPKSTIAVKAMELETRRQHPELVREMEALDLLPQEEVLSQG